MEKKTLRRDLLLIGTLLFVTAATFLLVNGQKTAGTGVVVCVNGEETVRYSLLQNGAYSLNGGTNVLVIEDGAAFIVEADCPDGLCIKQGKIRYAGQCLTCLPNKLTVTVYGGEDGVDFIV